MTKKEMKERVVRIRTEIVMLCQALPEPLAKATEHFIPYWDEILKRLDEIKGD